MIALFPSVSCTTRSLAKAKEHEQIPSLHRETTQVFTKSIDSPVLGKAHLDCVFCAKMHIILGFTRQLVEMAFIFTDKIESLHTGIATTRPAIVNIYEQAKAMRLGLNLSWRVQRLHSLHKIFMSQIPRLN